MAYGRWQAELKPKLPRPSSFAGERIKALDLPSVMFVWQAERDSTFGIAGCARDEAVAPHTIAPAGSIARPLDRTRGAPDIVVAIPEIGAMAMGWQSYHIYHEKASRKIPQMYNHDQEDNVQGK